MTTPSSSSSSSAVAVSRSIYLPREIQRTIFSYVPTFESMFKYFLMAHLPDKHIPQKYLAPRMVAVQDAVATQKAASNVTVYQIRPMSGPPSKKVQLRKGVSHVCHATSKMVLVEKIGNCDLFATVAEVPCSCSCHNVYGCLSPKFEIMLHLFVDEHYVPMGKLHRPNGHGMKHFTYSASASEGTNVMTKMLHMVMKDVPFIQHHMKLYGQYPHFQYIPSIWTQLVDNSSYSNTSMNFYVSDLGLTAKEFLNRYPSWAMEFVNEHYEGEEFYEDILHKYATVVRVHKASTNLKDCEVSFGKEFSQRLRMGEAIMPLRAHLSESRERRDYYDSSGCFIPAKNYAKKLGIDYPSLSYGMGNNTAVHSFGNDFIDDNDEENENFSDEDDFISDSEVDVDEDDF